MRGKITAAALGSLLAAGVPSAVAHAQPGVTVDPQSPAGVEYAIPLDSGRGHGGGHGHPGGGSGGNGGSGSGSGGSGGGSTLFGAGITPSRSGGSSAGAPGTRPGHGGSGAGGGASGPVQKRGGSTARRNASPTGLAPVSAAASYSTSGPIAGIVAAILVLGGGLGLIVRFRSRRTAGDKPLP